MKEIISNFKLSNKIFSKVLQEENLILNHDAIFEISSPINNAISFNLNGARTCVSTTIDKKFLNSSLSSPSLNFVFNGELHEDMILYLHNIRKMASFNIGICSKDNREFKDCKREYKKLKKVLEGSIGQEITEIEKTVDDHKVYVLSYRRK
jgi:hypothetical protein